eukprot:CFRG7717T1
MSDVGEDKLSVQDVRTSTTGCTGVSTYNGINTSIPVSTDISPTVASVTTNDMSSPLKRARHDASAAGDTSTHNGEERLNTDVLGVNPDNLADQATASLAAGQIIDALTADFSLQKSVDLEQKGEDYSARKRRLCTSCHESAKYTCPGCGSLSCSLLCVQKHKMDTGCEGLRVRTSFVSLKDFTDGQLANDYQFLEDVGKMTGRASRETAFTGRRGAKNLPKKLHLLVKNAKERGTIVQIMANGMHRRVCNTSNYNVKEGCLYWRVEWHLEAPVPDSKVVVPIHTHLSSQTNERMHTTDHGMDPDPNEGVINERNEEVGLPERSLPAETLHTTERNPSTHIQTNVNGTPYFRHMSVDSRANEAKSTVRSLLSAHINALKVIRNPSLRECMVDAYTKVPLDDLLVCMKVHERPSNSVRYHRLNLDDTLKEALKGVSVVEYPSVSVVLPSRVGEYDILGEVETGESENESESDSESNSDSDSGSGSCSDDDGDGEDEIRKENDGNNRGESGTGDETIND